MKHLAWAAVVTLVVLGAGLAGAADPWDAPDYRQRIALSLPGTAGGHLKVGLKFTGADFFRLTGFPRPSVRALLLGGAQGRVPLQVEERDGTGFIVQEGNGRLDDDDQVLFIVELGPTPQKLYLYYDGPEAPVTEAPTALTIKEGNPITLAGTDLTIAVRGGGLDDPSKNVIQNHGRGGIVFCSWKGTTVIDQTKYIASYFPMTIASGPGNPKWSEPVVVASGPARTVVEMHCEGYEAKTGEKVTLRGKVTHYVALWNDAPCADLEEVVAYTTSTNDFSWGYSAGALIGQELDANDRMVVPLMDQAYVVKLPTREEIADAPYRQLYSTWVPEEGWYAFQDLGEKVGMATFYENLTEIRERDTWVAYRPAWNPVLYFRTTPGPLEIRLSFTDRAARARSEWRRGLRYAFLQDERPEDIRLLYRCWGLPVDELAKVGAPERRPN